jgi:hypothetical protein
MVENKWSEAEQQQITPKPKGYNFQSWITIFSAKTFVDKG